MNRLLLICLVSVASLPGLHAQAVITWSTEQASSDADISTTGTSVWAYNFGNLNATLNTVNFTAQNYQNVSDDIVFGFTAGSMDQTTTDNLGSSSTPFTALSLNYRALLNSAAYFESTANATLTLQGLTPGNLYQVQIWNNDSRGAVWAVVRSTIYSDGLGNSATLDANTERAEGGIGNLVLGTFTASTSTQVIYGAAADGVVQFNAIQLRDVTVSAIPEPSTYAAIAGLAVLGLVALRRRV